MLPDSVSIGIQLASLRRPLEKGLETAARLGAAGVEIDARNEVRVAEMGATARRHLRKKVGDFGLRTGAIAYPTRRGYATPEDLDRRIDATKRAMQFAYDMGANTLLGQIGHIPEEGADRDRLNEALHDLGRYGQHIGVFFCATTGFESPKALLDLIESLPEGTLGVNFDPGALLIRGESAREGVELLGPHVRHVRASDAVRDLAQGRGVETQLGRGAANFPELAAILEEHRYRGYFTIQRLFADDPVAEISESVQYLKTL